MSTEKNCATPSSKEASPFLPHCSPQGLENINLDFDEDSDDDAIPAKLKKVPYSSAEDVVLAQCWIDTSIDSVVGNDQKLDQMWMRIGVTYNKNRPADTRERHWTSLKTHFYVLQKQVRWFSECYNRNAKLWGSGKSDSDIIELAQEEYKDQHKKQCFKHIGVWRLLSVCPKFALVDGDVRATKRAKNSQDGYYTSSTEDADVEHIRPIG